MARISPPRRSMVFALLATTAAAALLGACNQTGGLFSRDGGATEVKMTAQEAASATSRWAVAYGKKPNDPELALGYAKSLRAIGSKDRALQILKAAYQANPEDGQLAAELGRAALETGHLDVAQNALAVAASQGVSDWRTLSAQGTLHAKKGEHAEAQQYFKAALEKNPDSASVINNLALSYALDGKAKESEELLRQAAATGHDDKRIRQNLALVLGVQGKFDEARQVASVDMTEAQAKSSLSYLRNMLAKPTQVAAAAPRKTQAAAEDWSPFASNEPATAQKPVQTAAETAPQPAKWIANVQVVKPTDEVEAPAKVAQAETAKPAAPTSLLRADIR